MKFTYDGVEYDMLSAGEWTTLDAIKIEEASGRSVRDVVADIPNMGPLGLHAVAWTSLRRAGVDIAWGDLTLPYAEVLDTLTGQPLREATDPSQASTPRRKTASAGRARNAPPPKK